MSERPVLIKAADWRLTWNGLRRFSAGKRESACIWAGYSDAREECVEQVHFLDDLPGVRRHALFHRTPRRATLVLFEKLRRDGMVIIADVHTHSSSWVGLSIIDAAHPIEYRIGIVALVLPHYATGAARLSRVGVHSYLGRGQWKQLSLAEATRRIRIQ